jgi:deoxyribodipyrimidine photo-lyase
MMKFPATRQSALQRLEEFLEEAPRYAARRNHVLPGHPQVSRLSAALRHRLVTEAEVVEVALQRHPFRVVEKFLQEVLWRGYWKGWLELRPQVWERDGVLAARSAGATDADVATACREVAEGRSRSGIMNHFARELLETGYLHNHARMWWASFWVHHCGLPWELGAQHFFRHLLDADPASNTLSWRWVAGRQTRGKTYLVTEQNIGKFCAPELVEQAGGIGIGERVTARGGATNDVVGEEIQARPDFPHEIGPGDEQGCGAVVLHDEDFCLETSLVAGLRPKVLLHLVPADESPVAEPRAYWLAQARSDAVVRARDHFRCEVRVCRTCEDITHACVEENAGAVFMMEPFVGPLRDSLQGLPGALTMREIGLVRLRRKWDSALQPHAERGFFPFWNKVGRLLAKSGAEGLA